MLTPEAAGAVLGLSTVTLCKRRIAGTGPQYTKVGRKVFYREADLLAWLSARVHSSTSQYETHWSRKAAREGAAAASQAGSQDRESAGKEAA
jgi:hypothetical protein